MVKNKGWLSLVGFVLAGLGFLALILSIVGVKLSFLTWIDQPGPLFGFLMRIVMIVAGLIIIYFALTDFSEEE